MAGGKEREFIGKAIQKIASCTDIRIDVTDETLDGSELLLEMMEKQLRNIGVSWYGLEAGKNDSVGAVFNIHLGQLRRPLTESDHEQLDAFQETVRAVAQSQTKEHGFAIHASVKVQEDGKTPEQLQEELSKKPGGYELIYSKSL